MRDRVAGSGDRGAFAFRLGRSPSALGILRRVIRPGLQPAGARLNPAANMKAAPTAREAQIGAARPALRWGNELDRTPIRPDPGISCSDTAHSSQPDRWDLP
jgi:hypothetical protein